MLMKHVLMLCLSMVMGLLSVFEGGGFQLLSIAAAQSEMGTTVQSAVDSSHIVHSDALVYSIAAVMAAACIAAAWAVARVGAAAMGAAAEKPELLGRALIFVGLAEGIAIYGLIVAILLYLKL